MEVPPVTDREPFEFPHDDYVDTSDLKGLLEEMRDHANHVTKDDLDPYEEVLLAVLNDMAEGIPDWVYGETLIADDAFEGYARELADDIGAVSSDASWPNTFIDWPAAADALRQDYTAFEVDGITYWAR
jgi:hypothetical protein